MRARAKKLAALTGAPTEALTASDIAIELEGLINPFVVCQAALRDDITFGEPEEMLAIRELLAEHEKTLRDCIERLMRMRIVGDATGGAA